MAVAAMFFLVLGLCIGSFLNVVIARVPEGLSIVRPRSRCPRCGHELSWYENIPVFSWLALRGRCRGCKAPISYRYPAVELLTGLLFLACFARFGFNFELARALILVSLLIALTFIDAEHWVLPFEITLPGIAMGVGLAIPQGMDPFISSLLGAGIGFFAFRAMEFLGWKLFKKEALGGGDKYLLALLGAFLGPSSLLGVIFLASFQGAIFGIMSLAISGRAGPAPESAVDEVGSEPTPTMTWQFAAPGLSLGRRLLLFFPGLLFQPIPDEPVGEPNDDVDWVPGPTNLPFGPWLALAGLEILLLAPWLQKVLPPGIAELAFAGGGA